MTALFEYSTIRALAARLQTRDPARRPPRSGKLRIADIRNRKLRSTRPVNVLGETA